MARFHAPFVAHPASPEDNARETLKVLLRPIRHALEDESVDEIVVNTPDEIYIERAGRMVPWQGTLSANAVRSSLILLARLHGRDVREDGPEALLDVRYGAWRVSGVLRPVAERGDAVAFRRRPRRKARLEDFCFEGARRRPPPRTPAASPPTLSAILLDLVRQGENLLIAGGTSSGKTSLLNALVGTVPEHERLVVLEDTAELELERSNWIRLLAHESFGVDLRLLVRQALRLRPDRLVLGETRGAEAFDLVQAANTGHRGTMLTVHANGAREALHRLETLVLTAATGWPHEAIRRAVASAFGHVVHLERRDGERRVRELVRVDGLDGETYRLTPLIAPGGTNPTLCSSTPVETLS
jgi:Flp pilus assembly CpaF family ATPase